MLLKFDNNRFVGEGGNGCCGVLEVIDGGVAVEARCVHGAKRGVVIQHTLLRLNAVIEDERSCNADRTAARAADLLPQWQDSMFRQLSKIHRHGSWWFPPRIFLHYTTRTTQNQALVLRYDRDRCCRKDINTFPDSTKNQKILLIFS